MTIDFSNMRSLGLRRFPLGMNHLKDFTALNSELAEFLKPYAIHDVSFIDEDFKGFDLGNLWTTAGDSGSTEFAIPATALLGGAVTGATGTTDDNAISIRGKAIWKGDNNAGMAVRFKTSAITDFSFEIGFIDAVTDPTLPVITDVDTPASGNGASDIAVVHMDTDQALKTMAFVVDGVTSGMTTTKSNLGTLTPTAATYMWVCVQLVGDRAHVIIDDNKDSNHYKAIDAKIEGGTLVMPWMYFRTRVTTTRTIDIDKILVWGDN